MVIPLKSPRELDRTRKSGSLAAAIMDKLVNMVREGVTTGELDAAAEQLLQEAGAVSASKGYHGYPAHICTSSTRRSCTRFRGQGNWSQETLSVLTYV